MNWKLEEHPESGFIVLHSVLHADDDVNDLSTAAAARGLNGYF